MAVTYMDPLLYRAAMEGRLNVLKGCENQLEVKLTPNNNTVLHVAAQFLKDSTFPGQILEMQSSLLWMANSKGETPLHIAAREGHHNVVQALIGYAKSPSRDPERGGAMELLRMTNNDGDTALHLAVRNMHPEVVEILTLADPQFPHLKNNAEETPLYLAAERQESPERHNCNVVAQILRTCKSPAYTGPDGRTALHAAVILNCEGCTKNLCKSIEGLIKEADVNGWTPFHYAARFGNASMVTQLLKKDKSIAYLTADKDDKKTALHIAASHGCLEVMTKILEECPDCWEMNNGRGQNIIHIAVKSKQEKVVEFISKQPWCVSLVNQKDIHGNTPLHLYAASHDSEMSNFLKFPKIDINAFNNEKMTPLDVAIYTNEYPTDESSIEENLQSAGATHGWRNVISKCRDKIINRTADAEGKKAVEPDIKKTADTHLIVAALITTVAFTAGFTVPGGYDSDKGTAILWGKAAFQTFVISNTIAMVSSICAVFIHFIASAFVSKIQFAKRVAIASFLIVIGMGAMMIAFITGVYIVLVPTLGLAVTTCVLGSFSFPVYYYLLRDLIRKRRQIKESAEAKLRLAFILVAADHSSELED